MEKMKLAPGVQNALAELNDIVFTLHRMMGTVDRLAIDKTFVNLLYDESIEFADRACECIDVCKSIYGAIIESAARKEN